MKIFIDFDDVLFNTKKFKNDFLNKVFIKNGVSEENFRKTYYHFFKINKKSGKYYNPQKQIESLGKISGVDGNKLEKDFFIFMKDLKKYIFADVWFFLKKFNKKDLFLISYGDPLFQKMKVDGSGIPKFFKDVVLGKAEKMSSINSVLDKNRISLNDKFIIIDDLPKHLKKKGKYKKGMETFHLRRPDGRYSDLISKDADFEAKNLKEVFKIINKVKEG